MSRGPNYTNLTRNDAWESDSWTSILLFTKNIILFVSSLFTVRYASMKITIMYEYEYLWIIRMLENHFNVWSGWYILLQQYLFCWWKTRHKIILLCNWFLTWEMSKDYLNYAFKFWLICWQINNTYCLVWETKNDRLVFT